MKHVVAALLAALVCHPLCTAQVDAWERLKLIEPGKNVHVKLVSGKTVKGRMEAWSTGSLSVRRGKQVASLEKSEVAQVAMVTGMSRGRKAAYGALIGGAIGGGLGGAACAAGEGCYVNPGVIAAGAAIWVGGIAAGIAALFPQHKEVLYVTKPAPAR